MVIVACGPGPQNTSQSQDQNQSQNQEMASAETAGLGSEDVCELDDDHVADKIAGVKRRILEKMNDNLKDQHSGNVNVNGNVTKREPRFKYDVIKAPDGNYLIAYFEQGLSGADGLKDMANLLNDFDDKKCLLKVYFVPKGTLPIKPPINDTEQLDVFEWTACEWPKIACPNGVCHREPCPVLINGDSNGNSNTNSNSNRGKSN